ncbi:RNA polymerase sigma-70 factor (ECF subfamily) [Chitinophaga dinghuensis]|uniref:RNA polymerase sigma-70 factor (ECF subfamily) n=1 Tax=Chitinophaga dinghuensis TaxID=1539050 RepID=A0A327VNW3_9BACT|nr:sigma-70 family RNA polymerase sigma factor [Chitinophaga dinghuensis]RAJ75097.1 RNA polymerase sigma-70 factor (ECF subfamily) [Chitinophaga dinghuensis]
MVDPPTDNDLHKRLMQGEEKAFAELYNQYQPKLYLFIHPFTGFSAQDTDEVIQDVFFKLWLRKELLPAVSAMSAYLYMMARNCLRDRYRRQQVRDQAIADFQLQQPEQLSHVEEETHFQEYSAIARKAISLLPARKKSIFAMRHDEGMSLDEIADTLGITKFGVKKQLYDAVKFVRDYLKTHAGIDIPLVLLIVFYYSR